MAGGYISEKEIKELLLAIQLHKSNKRPTYFIDIIKTFHFSEKKKLVYYTYALIVFHKEKIEDEDGNVKVTRVEDFKASFKDMLSIYQWLGNYYKKLNEDSP